MDITCVRDEDHAPIRQLSGVYILAIDGHAN